MAQFKTDCQSFSAHLSMPYQIEWLNFILCHRVFFLNKNISMFELQNSASNKRKHTPLFGRSAPLGQKIFGS